MFNAAFLIKTPRYLTFVKSFNSLLFFVFIKSIINFSIYNQHGFHILPWVKFFFTKQCVKPFWFFFKKLFFKKYGIHTNNHTKSALYWTIKNISSRVFSQKQNLITQPIATLRLEDTTYCKPVQLISFAFHKKVYNTLILYIIFFLTNTYISALPTFQLKYSFLILPLNFRLYMFVNYFYFKVRNY